MAPTANAGPDQSIEDADADGFAEVLLDGTRSVDPEGDVLNVVWTLPDGDDLDLDADEIATGLSPTVRLPVGITTVTLKVTDAAGNIATDEVKITVISAADAESSLAGTPTGE
jgi:hypothetical protein